MMHRIVLPKVKGHPNRVTFSGVLTVLDEPSDKAPSGAKGHRVILTKRAGLAALPSLIGMAVDYKADWAGHNARQKCGIITSAWIADSRIKVEGYIFARDFPEVQTQTKAHEGLGMSYEIAEAYIADMHSKIWTMTKATFTGAAVLFRSKAAYSKTSFTMKA